ncbi:brachyurin-like [Neocloeon triangulifer]|uniref:brachyurin-like n=1 Tax=Neocloeon triangulifer TaxID=2078957 RepID=UPI00286F3C94|nr:brachyurin-like [Neocloeon triangulifer]
MRASTLLVLLVLLGHSFARCNSNGPLQDETTEQVESTTTEDEELPYSLELLTKDDEVTESVEESTETPNIANKPIQHPPIGEKTGFSNVTAREGRVLGGTAATAGQFGYYMFIAGSTASGTSLLCGGALLSEIWVITAAQCVATAASVTVYGGLITTPGMTDVGIGASILVHPSYKRNFVINDIALLRLLSPMTLSATISTIRISTRDPSNGLDNVSVRTMGMGPADDTTELATTPALNYIDLVNLKKWTCLIQTAETYVSYPKNAGCLSSSTATKGFCFADAGGPVVYTSDTDSSAKLIGINSQYLGCPSSYPMSYTRIYPYIPWIKQQTKKTFT